MIVKLLFNPEKGKKRSMELRDSGFKVIRRSKVGRASDFQPINRYNTTIFVENSSDQRRKES